MAHVCIFFQLVYLPIMPAAQDGGLKPSNGRAQFDQYLENLPHMHGT